jgi:uncharacterized membrane protein
MTATPSEPQSDLRRRRIEVLLDLAPNRVRIINAVLELTAFIVFCALRKWPFALGILIGGPIAELNLRWLESASKGMAERMVASEGKSRSFRLSFGFLGRYAVLILVGYVIFKSSLPALYGFLTALLLPVIAFMCEAAYEAVRSGRDPE